MHFSFWNLLRQIRLLFALGRAWEWGYIYTRKFSILSCLTNRSCMILTLSHHAYTPHTLQLGHSVGKGRLHHDDQEPEQPVWYCHRRHLPNAMNTWVMHLLCCSEQTSAYCMFYMYMSCYACSVLHMLGYQRWLTYVSKSIIYIYFFVLNLNSMY